MRPCTRADGTLVASAYETLRPVLPPPEWAEQDPADWDRPRCTAASPSLLEEVPEGPVGREGASPSARSSTAWWCVDAAESRFGPAMIWMDRRAEEQAAAVAANASPRPTSTHRVGANLDSSHAVFKALWVRDARARGRSPAAHC